MSNRDEEAASILGINVSQLEKIKYIFSTSKRDFDPNYIRIGKEEASNILGMSIGSFDKRRREDPRCPQGLRTNDEKLSKIVFILQDIYDYSECLTKEDKARTQIHQEMAAFSVLGNK